MDISKSIRSKTKVGKQFKNARALILAEPTLAAKQVFNVKPSRDVKHDRYRFREILHVKEPSEACRRVSLRSEGGWHERQLRLALCAGISLSTPQLRRSWGCGVSQLVV